MKQIIGKIENCVVTDETNEKVLKDNLEKIKKISRKKSRRMGCGLKMIMKVKQEFLKSKKMIPNSSTNLPKVMNKYISRDFHDRNDDSEDSKVTSYDASYLVPEEDFSRDQNQNNLQFPEILQNEIQTPENQQRKESKIISKVDSAYESKEEKKQKKFL